MMNITTIYDLLKEYDNIKTRSICYRDGLWFVEDSTEYKLDKYLCEALVDYNILEYNQQVISHHAYLIFKFKYITKKDLEQRFSSLKRLIYLLQEKRRFKSIKDVRNYLGEQGFDVLTGSTQSYCCYWSQYQTSKTLFIRDPKTSFSWGYVYNGFISNIINKNMLYRSCVRLYNNLYLHKNYPRLGHMQNSKYYDPNPTGYGYRFKKDMWEEDYIKFENEVLKVLKEM